MIPSQMRAQDIRSVHEVEAAVRLADPLDDPQESHAHRVLDLTHKPHFSFAASGRWRSVRSVMAPDQQRVEELAIVPTRPIDYQVLAAR
jgi:hypothetical protein